MVLIMISMQLYPSPITNMIISQEQEQIVNQFTVIIQFASVEVQLRHAGSPRGRQFCLFFQLFLRQQVLDSECLHEQIPMQLFLLRWRPFLPFLQKLQVPLELLLRYLCAELLHVEEETLQGLSGTLLVSLVVLSETEKTAFHGFLEDPHIDLLLQGQNGLPHLPTKQDSLEVQHPFLDLLPQGTLLEELAEVRSQEAFRSRGQLAFLLLSRQRGPGGRRRGWSLDGEASEDVLQGTHGGGNR